MSRISRGSLVVALMALPGLVQAYSGIPDGTIRPAAENAAFEQELIQLANAKRVQLELPPLKAQDGLTYAARYHAIDMLADGYYYHDTYDYGGIWVCSWSNRILAYNPQVGFPGHFMGMGFNTPEDVFQAWMDSPQHLEIFKSDFRIFGATYAEQGSDRRWVIVFGSAPSVYPLIIDLEALQAHSTVVQLYIHGAGTFSEMRLRNSTGVWTGWQPFQSEVTWTLEPRYGSHVVQVEMRNGTTTSAASDEIELVFPASDVRTPAPEGLRVHAFPNPFNPGTSLALELPQPCRVHLAIYDLAGRRVATLLDAQLAAGPNVVDWLGVDDRGTAVASGVYFARLSTPQGTVIRKLTLTR